LKRGQSLGTKAERNQHRTPNENKPENGSGKELMGTVPRPRSTASCSFVAARCAIFAAKAGAYRPKKLSLISMAIFEMTLV
jgi:hypothetical protein